MKRFIVMLVALAIAQATVTAQDLPRVEFAVGPGFMSYAIDCSYTDPAGTSAVLGDHMMTDWDNVDPGTTWDLAAEYPAEESVFALNSLLLVRFPLGRRVSKNMAYELNCFYFSTNIPSFTVEKVEALSDTLSLSGEAAGFAITAGARFGF